MVSEGERESYSGCTWGGNGRDDRWGKYEGDRHTTFCPTVTFKSRQCHSNEATNLAKSEKLAVVAKF